jgi:hypothetical protein
MRYDCPLHVHNHLCYVSLNRIVSSPLRYIVCNFLATSSICILPGSFPSETFIYKTALYDVLQLLTFHVHWSSEMPRSWLFNWSFRFQMIQKTSMILHTYFKATKASYDTRKWSLQWFWGFADQCSSTIFMCNMVQFISYPRSNTCQVYFG